MGTIPLRISSQKVKFIKSGILLESFEVWGVFIGWIELLFDKFIRWIQSAKFHILYIITPEMCSKSQDRWKCCGPGTGFLASTFFLMNLSNNTNFISVVFKSTLSQMYLTYIMYYKESIVTVNNLRWVFNGSIRFETPWAQKSGLKMSFCYVCCRFVDSTG